MTDLNAEQPGKRFRAAVDRERPLQVAGTVNALCALLAERAGFQAIYLSGAGVANASHGLPDLGLTTLADVVEDAKRITAVTRTPLLVDADTAWGDPAKTVRELTAAGAAGIHIEDQVEAKRCGHRPGKQLVPTDDMLRRLNSAVDARTCESFVIMARTDAVAVEGMTAAIDRAGRYVEAGAEMVFAEALSTLDEYRQFTSALDVPVLANITEFGNTPLFTVDELRDAGVRLVLYPLTAFRAMNAAAANVYATVRAQGTQRDLLESMQTRQQLYDLLDYESQESSSDGKQPKETRLRT